MSKTLLTIYVGPGILQQIKAGKQNFFCRVIGAVEARGWRVELREDNIVEFALAPERPGYALYLRNPASHEAALVCRRSYVGAFWQVEKTSRRWEWPITHKAFDPETVDPEAAQKFFDAWKKRVFPDAPAISDERFVLVPLQGTVFDQRDFQAMSPLEMIEATLVQTDLPLIVTMHPKAPLSERGDAALRAFAASEPRVTLREGGSMDLLPRCSFVVAQYSSVALLGYFFEKPAVLFATIDFQHIAGSVPRDGIEAAFAHVTERPDFARYLYWYLKLNSLNAGAPEFEDEVLATFRAHGWPI